MGPTIDHRSDPREDVEGQADGADGHPEGMDSGDTDRRPWLARHPYATLGMALASSFIVMFALTYVGVYRFADVYPNLNRFYMAVIMVAPMAVIMIGFMHHMFRNRWANLGIVVVAAVVAVGAFGAIQRQWLVGDRPFLRSMIPHHSIAVKTCKYADLEDVEIVRLCQQIISSQEEEIVQMKEILDRLDD